MPKTIEELLSYTTDEPSQMRNDELAYYIMVDGDNSGLSATFDGPPETPNAVLFNKGLEKFLEIFDL